MIEAVIRFLISVQWGRCVLGLYLGRIIIEPGYKPRFWPDENELLGLPSTPTTIELLAESLPVMVNGARDVRGCLYSPGAIAFLSDATSPTS